jgi:hypothetical protein
MTEMANPTTLEELDTAFLHRLNDLPETTTVCIGKHQRVPDGWVIVAETVLQQFPGRWPNAWIIKKPEEIELVCKVSPIPSDYVKIEEMGTNACPGSWPNAWKIERLTSATDA